MMSLPLRLFSVLAAVLDEVIVAKVDDGIEGVLTLEVDVAPAVVVGEPGMGGNELR